jgi:hypothetical protein
VFWSRPEGSDLGVVVTATDSPFFCSVFDPCPVHSPSSTAPIFSSPRRSKRNDGQVVGFSGHSGGGLHHPSCGRGSQLRNGIDEWLEKGQFGNLVKIEIVPQSVAGNDERIMRRHPVRRTDLDPHLLAANHV